jgi:hypothetical protein
MNETGKEGHKDTEGLSNEPYGNLELVIRMPISEMPICTDYVRRIPRTRIIYQKTGVGRLMIVPEE